MSDIFQEVDEELRHERYKKLWDRYGTYLIGVALAIVIGVGGWRAWEWHQERLAQEAGGRFEAAIRLIGEGKHAEAERALATLSQNAPSGYAMLARVTAAGEVAARDKAAAIRMYDDLVADRALDPMLRDLVQVRAGMLAVDTSSYADMARRLEPLAAPGGAFRHSARELLAMSAWKAGDAATAKRWAETAEADPDTPYGVRLRIQVLRALLTTN